MKDEVRSAIEKAIHIPSDLKRHGQVSNIDLYRDSGIAKFHDQITANSIQEVLRHYPSITNEWQQMCWDKRCDSRIAIEEYIFCLYCVSAPKKIRFYFNRDKAFANYIFHELNSFHKISTKQNSIDWKINSLKTFGKSIVQKFESIAHEQISDIQGVQYEIFGSCDKRYTYPLDIHLKLYKSNLGQKINISVSILNVCKQNSLFAYIHTPEREIKLPNLQLPPFKDINALQNELQKCLEIIDDFLENNQAIIYNVLSKAK